MPEDPRWTDWVRRCAASSNRWSDAEWQAWCRSTSSNKWSDAEWKEWCSFRAADDGAASSSSNTEAATAGDGNKKAKEKGKGKGKKWDTPGAGSRKRRDDERIDAEVRNIYRTQKGMPLSAAPLAEQIGRAHV